MPGYVMHLAEAEILLSRLEREGISTGDTWKNRFRLGCLLPDTKRKREKSLSHFWSPEDAGKLALAPDLGRFLSRYRGNLTNPLVLGYYVHLHLDALFVRQYWREQFRFQNAAGKEAEQWSEIATVHIRKTGAEVTVQDFFSIGYYYGDYSKMNEPFLQRFSLVIPSFDASAEQPVREVELEDLQEVLREVHLLAEGYYNLKGDQTLKVFDLEDLIGFIQKTAERIYPEIIDNKREL